MELTEKKPGAAARARLFDFDLGEAGWGTITLNFEDKSFEYPVSYLSHPVEDIIDALWMFVFNNALLIDTLKNKIVFSFTDEVSDYKLVLTRHDTGRDARCYSDSVFEAQVFKHEAGEDDSCVYRGDVVFGDFMADVLDSCSRILAKHGFVGFRYSWDDSGPEFPVSKFIELYTWQKEQNDVFYDDKCENLNEEIALLQRCAHNVGAPEPPAALPQWDLRYYLANRPIDEIETYIRECDDDSPFRQEMGRELIALCQRYRTGESLALQEGRSGFMETMLPLLEERALLLLELRADVYVVDQYGCPMLHHAAMAHSFRLCDKILRMSKQQIARTDTWGKTAIFANIPLIKDQRHDSNDFRVFDAFLRRKADLHFAAANKATPLGLIEAADKHYHNGLLDYVRTNYSELLA